MLENYIKECDAWFEEVSKLTGVPIEGISDKYYAFDPYYCFDDGMTPEAFVEMIKKEGKL